MTDPYQVLGVDPSASDAEVKKAYREPKKVGRPDKIGEKSLPGTEKGRMVQVQRKM